MAFEIRKSGSMEVDIAYTPDSAMARAREMSKFSADVVINKGVGLEASPWAFARYGKIYGRSKCTGCDGAGKSWAGAVSPCCMCRGHGVTSGDEIP